MESVVANYNIPQDTLVYNGGVKGLELRAIPILEPWELFPGGDLRHFVVEGI